jgi:hypothetical protein
MTAPPLPSRGFAAILIAIAFAKLCVWTWGSWPDVIVDFGRELYVPWRLSQGDVLYRDIAYFNGPLSPYANALLFRLFGVSVHTLFFANLVLLAGFCALLHELLRAVGDALSALAGVLLFLAVFAFGQQLGVGNYNFVAPYSHEATHGLMLAVGALVALAFACRRQHAMWLIVSGLCVGLSLLTKLEMAIAAVASSVTGLACILRQGLLPVRADRATAYFVGGISLPPLAASALLPGWGALAALVTPFRDSATLGVASLAFYRNGMGFDHPLDNGVKLLACAAAFCLAFAPAIIVARRLATNPRRTAIGLGTVAAYALVLFAARQHIAWTDAARALPLGCLLVLGHCMRQQRRGSRELRTALGIAFAVLALVLLSKMLLNASVRHYGFVLAVPGLMLLLVVVTSWLPSALDARGAFGGALRAAACVLFAVLAYVHLERTAHYLDQKTVSIGRGADVFLADMRGVPLRAALAALETRPADSTFAVLPEGVMLNFLARRRNPTPFINFMPPELALFGETRMLSSFAAHPPNQIVLVHKDTSEYGFAFFGRDYGVAWLRWVHANYGERMRFGDAPFSPESRFGVDILTARDVLRTISNSPSQHNALIAAPK